MRNRILVAAAITAALATPSVAARVMVAPLAGQKAPPPDLEGIWSFSTLTPVERPGEAGGRPFFTDEEAAAFEKRSIDGGDRHRRDGGAAVDVARAVNDYWFERGTHVSTVNGGKPSSMVTDPLDGRIPAQTPDARAKAAARAADNRAHPADGPENRSLQERCLAFNAGPPILPGPYNNYVQLLQFPGYVIVFKEMIHDARIVPLDGRPHRSPSIRMPWTAVLPMTETADRMFEYTCHEGNHALEDILRGARYQEKAGTPNPGER